MKLAVVAVQDSSVPCFESCAWTQTGLLLFGAIASFLATGWQRNQKTFALNRFRDARKFYLGSYIEQSERSKFKISLTTWPASRIKGVVQRWCSATVSQKVCEGTGCV
jgi:hypothetical protein